MFGKTAIITGGSGGIGSATAKMLAQNGYNIAAAYKTNAAAALALERPVTELGGLFAAVKCDVTSSAEAAALAEAALKMTGKIDLLVNCAGVSLIKQVTDTDDGEYSEVFGVNMGGVFNCSRAVLPQMIRQKSGAIVNISSMWGVCGASCEAVYSASKAAVIGFTKALAKEVAPSGITVNCVAPGVIDTAMNAALTPADIEQLKMQTPLGRIGTPDDVAAAVLFLVQNRFVTAQTVTVDGGFTA